MRQDEAGSPARSRLLLGLSLVLVAANLRPIFSSLGAVLPDVMRGTGASALAGGVLTTLPVMCLGLFAPLTPGLVRRFGAERVLFGVMLLLTAGTALRGVSAYLAILAGSVAAGAAIAVGNVVLPGLVKRDFADRTALMTALYVMAICGGGALGAGLTVPLTGALGGWAAALAAWAVPAACVAVLWAPQVFGAGTRAVADPHRVTGLWRDRLAWRITILMGLQSALAYCVFGWLAPILRERGLDAAHAGYLVSLSFVFQLAASLGVPWLATRGRDQRATTFGLLACAVIGFLVCLFAPLATVVPAVILLGIGQGGLLAVTMMIILLRSPDPHVASHLSSMAQGVGYVIAATGPLLVGLIRSATGSFAWAGLLFTALGLVAGWAAWSAGQQGHVGAVARPAGSSRATDPVRRAAAR